jgi:hypothetical protein
MKNIHLISTDKPSRLWTNNLKRRLELNEFPSQHPTNIAKNIYITSDVEIKTLEYEIYYDKVLKKVGNAKSYGKKIILTTDQDLIKDGVQPIDDEFLEWFVRNPSCEKVEVINEQYTQNYHKDIWYNRYKIIIPKEEAKQSTVGKEFYESADKIITVYKQDIIQLIEDRILSEYKKHSISLPDEWAKIAAHKIYKSISDIKK